MILILIDLTFYLRGQNCKFHSLITEVYELQVQFIYIQYCTYIIDYMINIVASCVCP
jgi:hypothetical protein